MVNSGKCSRPRSRSRNTRANSNILVSPAANNFLQANSGEVRRYRVARSPSEAMNSTRGACKWVSLPGETCRIAVSTSVKPCSSNQARAALVTPFLAAKNGLISARRAADHHGEGLLSAVINQSPYRVRKMLASKHKISMLQPETAPTGPHGSPCQARPRARISGKTALKVIASSIRKGNIIEQDGKLYVVLTAENIHPGKGTPVSQIEMRRISDGVKVSERYKTTDQVEKATIEDNNFNYLYEDADGFHFMNTETYDQLKVPKDGIGTAAPYLQENMTAKFSLHGVIPVAIQMPQRATLEVVDPEPVTKGQTASSSYKPAMLSNGVRTMVPPHIGTGTRIVIMTEDGSYVERAKD